MATLVPSTMNATELKFEADRLGLEVRGTGKNGRKLRGDYESALSKYLEEERKKKTTPRKKQPKKVEECTIHEFKYAVVATGYTDRLEDRIEEVTEKVTEKTGEEESGLLSIPELDYNDSQAKDEIDYVVETLGDRVSKDYLLFKCEDLWHLYDIIDALGELDYCAFLTLTSVYKYTLLNGDILIATLDTESG